MPLELAPDVAGAIAFDWSVEPLRYQLDRKFQSKGEVTAALYSLELTEVQAKSGSGPAGWPPKSPARKQGAL